ncbi:vitelline membrane outer layer protein 1 homolog [Mercenaria mercenaria]|uniref:vitelline membrane outer layer protein 1 homolog n=1 Tax=Mercenaria mercenaria TaxID=6596 RepID=UPI00234E6AD5|nr:vitelline membrane outer layer protein 1 homolog [Mercenaria mercenaria]
MAGRCGTRPCESTQKCVGTVDIYTCIDTDLEQVLGVPNGGDLGWWMGGEECDEGTFAMGYEMKIEANLGQGDDTALNGIKLICKSLDGTLSNTITSATAPWGDWTGETYCTGSHGPSFLTSFGLQVDPWTGDGEDDTAANFIKFKCRDIAGIHEAYELSKDPGIGDL